MPWRSRVLDEFLRIVDNHRRPTALAERTLAKCTLLAEAGQDELKTRCFGERGALIDPV